ncbi:MAG: hypothetical protein N2D54_05030, partial [Chloroflexota bacterium]
SCAAPQPEPTLIPSHEPKVALEPNASVEPSPTVVPSPTPHFATSTADIVGEWKALRGFYMQFFEDETYRGGTRNPGLIGHDAPVQGEYWFEDTTLFMLDTRNDYYVEEVGEMCLEIGSYVIWLLENGDVVFDMIVDDCEKRREVMGGVISSVK